MVIKTGSINLPFNKQLQAPREENGGKVTPGNQRHNMPNFIANRA